ncbi:hypothetical protein [Enterocloster clostridioformis]|nr:hypothetical protein [Enterocloster clostridioformis]MDB2128595.1 hypothetical protein [Enterocloster clostridioformis]
MIPLSEVKDETFASGMLGQGTWYPPRTRQVMSAGMSTMTAMP